MYTPKGSLLEGHWMHGKMHGFGRKIFKDGDYFLGTFRNGKLDGEGYLECFQKSSYSGGFANDLKEGYGV